MDVPLITSLHRAARTLARTPALTIASLVTLALGIGANTALFTVVYGVLLRPLPFADPDRLVQLNATRQSRGGAPMDFSLPEFQDWQARTRSFDGLALFGFNQYSLATEAGAEALRGAVVSSRFFHVLGAGVILGRALAPDDDRVPSVVISHRLWTRRFQADAGAIGKSVVLNGQAYTVVGVTGAAFTFPAPDVDLWVPAEFSATLAPPQWRMRGFRAFAIVARLEPGVGLPQARADVADVARGLAQAYPRFNQDTAATVVPLRDRMTERVRPALLMLFGAVSLVLLVACANVAGLALARTAGRAREVATRRALGATRADLVRQFLTESAVLAFAGAAAGLLVAIAAVGLLRQMGPAGIPRLDAIRVDGAALAFCATLALGSIVLFGTVPALHLSRGTPIEALRDGRSPTMRPGRRAHAWLVIAEVAISVTLIVGAALLTRSLGAMMREDIGVENRGVLTLKLNLSSPAFADPARQTAFLDRLVLALAALPGAQSIGLTSHLPPNVSQMHTTVSATNEVTGRQEDYGVEIVAASEQLFHTFGVPLLAGRLLSTSDTADAPRVVVLGASTARRLFKDANAIGRTVSVGPRDPSGRNRDPIVVGVVGDVRYSGFDAAPDGAIYMPYAQRPFRVMYLVVRPTGDPSAVAADVRRAVAALDAGLAVSDVRRLDAIVAEAVAGPRFRTILLGLMAALAIVLASAGIYGVLSYGVSQRTAEIGVRMALGAEPSSVRRMVMRQGLALWGAGICVGLGGAYLLARALDSLLYGISRVDAPSFLAGPACLLAATLAASYVPARRATRVDPLVALRHS
jgi:predicted permease